MVQSFGTPLQVHIKVSSMDGNDEITRPEGIEAHVLVSLGVDL
jgi:hypothetical protein